MADGDEHVSLDEIETNPEKPGDRWELSPILGIDGFNVNVGVLDPGERLSQNHYHYHEGQKEFFYVASGRCRAEVADGHLDLEPDDVLVFDSGEAGVHVIHNPYDEPCKLVAIGWPREDRYPVEQVATTDGLLEERYGSATPD